MLWGGQSWRNMVKFRCVQMILDVFGFLTYIISEMVLVELKANKNNELRDGNEILERNIMGVRRVSDMKIHEKVQDDGFDLTKPKMGLQPANIGGQDKKHGGLQ